MRDAIKPSLHLFVCANRREGSPLGPGCSDQGDAVYDALKREVAARGITRETWITKTMCLGICPQHGATVGRYPPERGRSPILTEVVPGDVAALLQASPASTTSSTAATPIAPAAPQEIEQELRHTLDALEELQRKKVLDLARRLKPGLTLEDVQNPHDFPELDDPDWHYADGVLAGISSVKSAWAALAAERAQPLHAGSDSGADLEETNVERKEEGDAPARGRKEQPHG